MKLLHLSDLHLGKRVNEYSMLEDQRYILREILRIADAEKPQAVLIAGDIYDKPVPPAEAVELFDQFLVELTKRSIKVLVISGNHDSAERIAFGARLLDRSGVYLSPVYDGTVKPVTLTDEFGEVDFFLLPFLKPAHVRRCFPDEKVESYTDAVRTVVVHMERRENVRRVILTHQFVTGAERCESEEISVGGSDNVDASVFDGFDYVALGHIHGPQKIGKESIRYCGTPLKYSFSEAKHQQSVTVVELGEEGSVKVRSVPLRPLRDMVELRGTYEELSALDFYKGSGYQESYLHITLLDEEDVPDAMAKLRVIYPFLMKLDYDNRRTRFQAEIEGAEAESKSPLELFGEFYEKQNNRPMTDAQRRCMERLIGEIWEEDA